MTNYPKFNHDKAYLLGLLVGGGKVSSKSFLIALPYNKWGMNPQNMNIIAKDILTKICNKFRKNYGFSVNYEIGNNKWLIKPIGNIDLKPLLEDLKALSLPTKGDLINTVDLTFIKSKIEGIEIEHFLSGIFDTRASLAESHRRFNDDAPVVSIEIPGSSRNFKFVVQLCSWLTELGTITDQILYNHPCQHSPSDSDYSGWKKGFKIRFLAKSFLTKNSFAMQSKSFGVTALKKQQKKEEQLPCKERKPKFSTVAIHKDINSDELPLEVRNKVFFHYHHLCSILKCPFAPTEEVKKSIKDYKNLISVFPKLSKGTKQDVALKFNEIKSKYFPTETIIIENYTIEQLIRSEYKDYYQDLEIGIAYLFSQQLNGKRHIGPKNTIINKCLNQKVSIFSPENISGTPIMLENSLNDRAIIVSSVNSKFNQQIIDKMVEVKGIEVSLK